MELALVAAVLLLWIAFWFVVGFVGRLFGRTPKK